MKVFVAVSAKGAVGKSNINANLSEALNQKLQNVLALKKVPQNFFGLCSAHKDGLYRNAFSGGQYSSAMLESNQISNILLFSRLDNNTMRAMLGNIKVAIEQQDQSIPETLACNQDLIKCEPNYRGADDLISCASLLQVLLQDKR